MRSLGAMRAILRRIRAERGVIALLFGLVAITCLVVALSPRLFERVADEGLRYDVERATSGQRDLSFTTVDEVRAGQQGDPLGFVLARGDRILERVPASVQEVIDARDVVVETPRFGLAEPPNYPTFITMRLQDGAADRVTYTAGRPPAYVDRPADPMVPPPIEIALSTETAQEIKAAVGDMLPATADGADSMLRLLFPRREAAVEFRVVGLFTIDDPSDPAWFDDLAYARAAIGGSEDSPVAFATALVAPEAYRSIDDLTLPSRYRWRFHVDPARLDAGRLEALTPDLRRLETTFSPSASGDGVRYRSGLLDVIDGYLARRAASEAVLAVAAIGPLTVALGALGLVAAIIIRRRRGTLALARGRGASAGQILGAQLWEGLLVTLPAALAGLLAATLVVPARAGPVSAAGAGFVAFAVTGLLLIATWPRARRARRDAERADIPGRRFGPRRVVFEATIVGLALAAAWLLRERGLGAARPGATATAGFDPFVAAAPLLIGVAIALLTIRLYPYPVRALGRLSARRRDLVPSLGLRTIGRDPASATLPLLVVTVTVAIGVFASVLALTIERGQVVASWDEVGADVRLTAPTGTTFRAVDDPATVAGVGAVARALVAPAIRSGAAVRGAPATFIAIEPERYAAVLAGAPVGPPFDAATYAEAPLGPEAGSAGQPIPVVVSRDLAADWGGAGSAGPIDLEVRGETLQIVVAGIADAMPGVPRGAPFIVAPFPSVAAGWDGPTLRPNVLYLRASAAALPGLRELVGPAPDIASRQAILSARRDAPLVAALGRGFGLAVAASALYAALAIVSVIVLDAQRRAREVAYLRTMGLTHRQSTWLTFVEHGPPTVLALAVGIVLGLGVAWLTEPGLGLGAFIGDDAPVRLQIDWLALAVIAGVVLAVIGLMVAISSWLARRLEPAQVLRLGDG